MGNKYLDSLRLNTNPILTALAQGYSNNAFISSSIYPVILTDKFPTLRVPEMNRDHLKIVEDLRTLYGTSAESINGGMTYIDVDLQEHTQKKAIDIQELISSSIIDLRKTRAYALVEGMLLNIEKAVADEVQNASNYASSNKETLTGTDQWTDSSSDPITQIEDAKEVVRTKVGKYPNVMVLGATAKWSLVQNTEVVKAILGPNAGGKVTIKQLEDYLEMKIAVGSAIYDNSELISDTFAPVDLWSDNCILAYVTEKPADQRSIYTPSFGYTFKHKNFSPKMGNWKQPDGLVEWVQGTMIWGNKMMNSYAGYLIKDTNA